MKKSKERIVPLLKILKKRKYGWCKYYKKDMGIYFLEERITPGILR
ncbi:MAG: hypothetical protein IJ772_01330 [Bacilli bacterium]|nr:hypothetical protein [Bacilli bacterium]